MVGEASLWGARLQQLDLQLLMDDRSLAVGEPGLGGGAASRAALTLKDAECRKSFLPAIRRRRRGTRPNKTGPPWSSGAR
jgi:hypothetical protein